MYFSDIGIIALMLALGFAVFAIVIAVVGAVREQPQAIISAKRAVLAVSAFLVLASAMLVASFLTHDFGVKYVAEQSSRSMPWYFTSAAFYGGQEGSLLYWALMLGIFSAIFVFTSRRAPTKLVPYVLATLMVVEGFFVLVLVTVSNPFVRLPYPPQDGTGLNPLLMDPGMLVHPPTLLMGYMSFSVPFAFAVAALLSGEVNSDWLRSMRRWMLASWSIQTAGLLLGSWWAYHVLGWGGYWGWDPVENAALLPWLTATAFLHSTMVQERRGMLKVWNMFLVIASFALSIFGTFEVRSGIISSVHSFAYSDIGVYFFAFLAVIIIFSTALFFFRLPKLKPDQEFDSVVSREGVFLLNNLMLLGITFATLWGTLFPLISATIRKQTMTVGAPFYNSVNGPLFAVLILAMGIGPLLAWRRTSPNALWRNLSVPTILAAACALVLPLLGVTDVLANIGFSVCAFTAMAILYELWRGARVRHAHGEPYWQAVYMLFKRYRQRYGGYVVHLGLVLLAAGVIGSHFFQVQKDVTLKSGQETTIGGYLFVYKGNLQSYGDGQQSVAALMQVWRNGTLVDSIRPGRTMYKNFDNQPASQIAITTLGVTDLYVFLGDWSGPSQATIRIFINPLVPLVWYGGVIMLLGGLLCWWPDGRKRAVYGRQGVKNGRAVSTTPEEISKVAVDKGASV
ncbi:heme lyase CcmF/NrfE family subunit [Ktedonobacter racemifer]|uniref:Cytochrome c assembly protein n=1 Tax=Ktedonobacter racemifer DSM 44963 TaxID=485913 RepID=D6TNF3_KTERA|nr:heme lyase CcmF/NrfE family subunit [Ktedonobacter racemifer]EFH87284.1 cytochrome c assembly protein [Ktedonobacter racemifer DSM 44963]